MEKWIKSIVNRLLHVVNTERTATVITRGELVSKSKAIPITSLDSPWGFREDEVP